MVRAFYWIKVNDIHIKLYSRILQNGQVVTTDINEADIFVYVADAQVSITRVFGSIKGWTFE